jgi:hypothetical protein
MTLFIIPVAHTLLTRDRKAAVSAPQPFAPPKSDDLDNRSDEASSERCRRPFIKPSNLPDLMRFFHAIRRRGILA